MVWKELKERVIALRTMSLPLRALTLLAMAVLAAAFVLGLVAHAGLPETTISAAGAGPIKLPVPALVLILVGFGLAWCYALSASLYVHPLLRLAILCLFTFAMLDQGTLFSPALESGRSALLVAALAAQWLIVVGTALPGARKRAALTRWSAPILFVLTGVIQVLAWWSSNAAHVPGAFALEFVLELTVFAILASVYLCSAGGEFAQVADLISGAIAERWARSRWLLAAAAAAVAGVLLMRAVVGAPSSLVWNVLLAVGAALVCVVVLRARAGSRRVGRVPSWAALVTGAAVSAALTAAAALATTPATPAAHFQLLPPTLVYYHAPAPSFSIAYPPGWGVKSLVRPSGLSEFELGGQVAGVSSLGELFAFPRGAGASATIAAPQAFALVRQVETLHYRGLTVLVVPAAGRYRYSLAVGVGGRVALLGHVGLFWTPRYLWVVQVIANPIWWRPMTAVADYMVNSWRPNGSAPPVDLSPAVSVRTPTAYFAAIGLGLALVLGLVLLLVPLSMPVAGALGCVFVAMLLAGLVDFREAIALITGRYHAGGPHVNMRALELMVGLGVLGAVVMSRRPGRLHAAATAALPRLAILGASLLVISLLFSLYAGAAAATFTVTGVAFLLGAFLWDVALCGDVVNGDGKLIRRPGRVLLYLSYLLATSAATLYFASAHTLGTLKMEDSFAPEVQVALSVIFVGIAWVVVSFFGRFGAEAEPVEVAEPASEPEPAPEPVPAPEPAPA